MLRFQLDTTGNLIKDLISFWPLDEPGGQRRDMLGYNPLTDNATVTSAKGIGGQGTAALFTRANSEYLSRTDQPNLSATGDFTLSAWVYATARQNNNVMAIGSKWDAGGVGSGEWYWRLDDDGTGVKTWQFVDYDSADTAHTVNKSASTFAAGRWYFVVAWRGDGNYLNLQVDNDSPTRSSTTMTPKNSDDPLRIGAMTSPVANFWDGRIQYFGYWWRALSQQERTDLYNNGKGNRLLAY